jgi:hypothetical protein
MERRTGGGFVNGVKMWTTFPGSACLQKESVRKSSRERLFRFFLKSISYA